MFQIPAIRHGFTTPYRSIDNRDVTGIGNAEFSHYTRRCAPEVESRSNLALIKLNKDLVNSQQLESDCRQTDGGSSRKAQ